MPTGAEETEEKEKIIFYDEKQHPKYNEECQ